jgi:hypothetical protein
MAAPEPVWVDADSFDGELDHDFDAAWAQLKPKYVRAMGRVYRMPAELPASVVILLARQRRTTNKEQGLAIMEQILKGLLTPAGYDQIIADGIGLESQLGDLVSWCVKAYNTKTGKDDAESEGEAEPPATGATGRA